MCLYFFQAIKTFLSYLENWDAWRKQHKVDFLSDSTAGGLKVTLKATLELFDFLHKEHGFEYLMTSRLSQDNLEVKIFNNSYMSNFSDNL